MRSSRLLPLVLALGCARESPVPPPPAFSVEADAVRLHAGVARPLRFPTVQAELGAPLPGPPVTARVTTVPALTAPSFAPLEGRVAAVKVKLGDLVEHGDRLVLVQTTELPVLNHALAAAKLEVRTRAAIVARMQRLVESRVGSEHDLIIARSELAEAELAVKTAGSRLRSLAVEPEGDGAYWILANRTGTVVQLDATQGLQVGPDSARPVATIADLRELLIVGDAAQRDAAGLRPGITAEVRPAGSVRPPVSGVLEAVSQIIDPERQTVPLRVHVVNDGSLRPNAYVELRFAPPPEARALLIPAAAVVSDGASSVVFVEEAPNLLRRRAIEVGRSSETTVEVVSGLRDGERVVTGGALLLRNAIDVEV
jgi:cobalt-zinc-cadmium efflux system membrane fusion protein